MNSLAWIGIIVWGIVVTGIGLGSAGAPSGATDIQPQDVAFLVAGGFVTCLIGVTGLLGLIGWVPGLRKDKETAA